jgi:hypothetical protein
MKGSATLTLSEAAMMEAVQRYLDEMAPLLNRKVDGLKPSPDGLGGYLIITTEKQQG